MAKRGRVPVMRDPIFTGVRVERWEREMLEALALLGDRTLTDEVRLAITKHLRTSIPVHVDDHRKTNARQAGRALAKTYSREEAGDEAL